MSGTPPTESKSVVICGAGIIGLSTAYYLSLLAPDGTQIYILDTSPTLFDCASGRAGGFLAEDWFPPHTSALGALSFKLHRDLAAKHDGGKAWGYAASVAYSVTGLSAPKDGARGEDWLTQGASRATAATPAGAADFPSWLAPAQAELISTSQSTAQVDPEKLCRFLLAECEARGVQVLHPVAPSSIALDDASRVSRITYTTNDGAAHIVPCTSLVLTAGVWTPKLFRTLFPTASGDLPVVAMSGHSLVLRSPRWVPPVVSEGAVPTECAAIFAADDGYGFSPELFSRAHGDIYVAGHNTGSLAIEATADLTKPDINALAELRRCAAHMLAVPEDELDVVRGSLCHRPVGPSGRPLVMQANATLTGGAEGVYVAAGHGPWGISMSLGTGLVMAETVLGRKPSADISRLGV
ncbi:nucleotide-binding domain-containing protein [Peniophora sp. CONT]|nr:nucleotide-binding domain-containing protein [Peniophora sp. CONT]